jgi:glycosyltransferase 2 family protein
VNRTAASGLAWLSGALLLAALVFVVAHSAEEQALAHLLARAEPIWLALAALCQALTYVCAAAVWQRALVRHHAARKTFGLVPLGLAKLFTDQALPSAGVSGTLFVVGALGRRGVPRAVAVASVLAGLVGFYAAYFVATLASLVILWRYFELRGVLLVPVAFLCLVAAGLPLAIVGLRGRAFPQLSRRLERLPGAHGLAATLRDVNLEHILEPRLLLETTALQLAIFALDALTLAVTLRAVGSPVELAAAFASFVIASVVATLAWIPGGLGTFEGTCVAMLHLHGVSVGAGLAATLLLRGFTFWLPMLPGFALARRELTKPRA